MGRHPSHSVTCHPTQVDTPRLTTARQAGTWFSYLRGMEGWVDLGGWLQTRWFVHPQTVTHPSTNWAQHRANREISSSSSTGTGTQRNTDYEYKWLRVWVRVRVLHFCIELYSSTSTSLTDIPLLSYSPAAEQHKSLQHIIIYLQYITDWSKYSAITANKAAAFDDVNHRWTTWLDSPSVPRHRFTSKPSGRVTTESSVLGNDCNKRTATNLSQRHFFFFFFSGMHH